MVCFSPSIAYKHPFKKTELGKSLISFKPFSFSATLPLILDRTVINFPCGQCMGCRLDRSRMWSVRCIHEASLYKDNCFITLTFNNESLDPSRSLVKRDFQLFMKRLRFRFGANIRYFHCGEYGERFSRPHHHAILFNFDFPDKEFLRMSGSNVLYSSKSLQELWPFGLCAIGSCTFDSAAYCARYIMKKITGKNADDHYQGRLPEYNTMSRRPGIAREWYNRFKTDVYPGDFVVVSTGKKTMKIKPPKFYDRLYELDSPEDFAILKSKRIESGLAYEESSKRSFFDRDPLKWDPENLDLSDRVKRAHDYHRYVESRLGVRKELLQLRLDKLLRGYESGEV